GQQNMTNTDQNHQQIQTNQLVTIALAVLFVLGSLFCVFSIWILRFSLQRWGILGRIRIFGILFFMGIVGYRQIGFTLNSRETLQVLSMIFTYFYTLMGNEKKKPARVNKAIHKFSKYLMNKQFQNSTIGYKRLVFDWLS